MDLYKYRIRTPEEIVAIIFILILLNVLLIVLYKADEINCEFLTNCFLRLTRSPRYLDNINNNTSLVGDRNIETNLNESCEFCSWKCCYYFGYKTEKDNFIKWILRNKEYGKDNIYQNKNMDNLDEKTIKIRVEWRIKLIF